MTKANECRLAAMERLHDKTLERLSELDPASPEFNYTLNNLGLLLQVAEQVKFADNIWVSGDPEEPAIPTPVTVPPTNDDPLILGVTEPEDTAPWETEVSASPDEELKLEDVRAKLVALARSGVDLSNLFQGFGATKLSEVPKEKYGELLKLANAAAEESA